MNRLPWLLAAVLLVGSACTPSPEVRPSSAPSATPTNGATPTVEAVTAPRIPTGEWKVLQTIDANLDQDAAEEQILVLQNRSNLSLPLTLQVADFDQARKTYYLAWEGRVLASAAQPYRLSLDDLIGDHQQELVVQGLDESGKQSLDILRLEPPNGNLGLAYRTIFGKVTTGTIQVLDPVRPTAYSAGQNSDVSAPVVVDEPDPSVASGRETLRTTYRWLFQKRLYVAAGVERVLRDTTGDATLEKLFAGDTAGLEAFLDGPWVRSVNDKAGLLILFFDRTNPAHKEISFATAQAQEIYHWQVTSRISRAGVALAGSNDLIELIKLQVSIAITAADTIEVNSAENPNWSGTYKKLDPSAAQVLARQGSQALAQETPPEGLYRNDKGDEFDFQVPELRLKLSGVVLIGSMAVYPLGGMTILQVKVPARPDYPGLSVAYAMVAKEESNTSRIVRTLKLQKGRLTSKGWVSDQSEPLRLEQVEGTTNTGDS